MTESGPAPLNLDREDFLARYWQRKPLYLPGAIANFKPPVSSQELAGLALEEGIESRLVEYRDDQWLLHHGPFQESDYDRDHPWTLLVQAVDHWIPEVAELRKLVDFLPQWRVDDVMVSYAPDGGSVGPHFDNYDVFLLQGMDNAAGKSVPIAIPIPGCFPTRTCGYWSHSSSKRSTC